MKRKEQKPLDPCKDQRLEIPKSNRLRLHPDTVQHETDDDNKKISDKVILSDKQRVSFTKVTKDSGILTKRMKMNNGNVEKDSSECKMSSGTAETVSMEPEELGPFLRSLKPHQAIIHGVPHYQKARITTAGKIETSTTGGLPVVARTLDFFQYPKGPGLLMLDHDKPRDNAVTLEGKALQTYRPEELTNIIAGLFQPITTAAWVSSCSTSSCIYDIATGTELRGQDAGFHLYFFLKNAADAPRFLEVLHDRLILAGYGRMEYGRDGSELKRSLVDSSVASPERLDFVAGTACDTGLEQRLPDPVYHPGDLLDSEALHDLTPEEVKAYQEIIQQLKEKGAPDQERIKKEYLEQEAGKLSSVSGGKISMEQARETVKARQHHILADDDLLSFQNHAEPVTVAEVLEDGELYNGEPLADPLEPEYNCSRSVARFYWNDGTPIINSFAHGTTVYKFASITYPGGSTGIDPVEAFGDLPACTPSRFLNKTGVQVPDDIPNAWDIDEVLYQVLDDMALINWMFDHPGTELTLKERGCFRDDILFNTDLNPANREAVAESLKAHFGMSKPVTNAQYKHLQEARLKQGNAQYGWTHIQVSDDFTTRHSCVGAEGQMWFYNEASGIYEPTQLEKFQNAIAREYNTVNNRKSTDNTAIAHTIYNDSVQPNFFKDAVVGIPCKSAFYQVEGEEITAQPYTKELRQRFKLTADPTPGELPKNSLWSRYLNATFKHSDPAHTAEQIELLSMICGGMLMGVFAQIQIAVLLFGGGSNGKSVIIELLQSFFPEDARAAVQLHRFNDEYSRALLAGTRINIVGEIDKNRQLSADFKDIVGAETMVTARHPYGKGFTFIPTCAHLTAGNAYPSTNDHSEGFYRRWRVLQFLNRVKGTKIPHLGRRIATDEAGIFLQWATEGAKKLIAAGYSLPETIAHTAAMDDWKNEQDSVKSFFNDTEVIKKKADLSIFIKTSDLYQTYATWCKTTGTGALKRSKFLPVIRERYGINKKDGYNILRSFKLQTQAFPLA